MGCKNAERLTVARMLSSLFGSWEEVSGAWARKSCFVPLFSRRGARGRERLAFSALRSEKWTARTDGGERGKRETGRREGQLKAQQSRGPLRVSEILFLKSFFFFCVQWSLYRGTGSRRDLRSSARTTAQFKALRVENSKYAFSFLHGTATEVPPKKGFNELQQQEKRSAARVRCNCFHVHVPAWPV